MSEADRTAGPTGGEARRARFSIARLMTIVLFIAADFAIVRSIWNQPGPSPAFFSMVLPTANLLILGLVRLIRPGPDWRFWAGFEVVGWSLIGALAYLELRLKPVLFYPLTRVDQLVGFPNNSPRQVALGVTCCLVFYVPPQLILACLGGRLASLTAGNRRAGGDR